MESLKTRETVGFEALVRWAHPEHGLLTPSKFVPFAGEGGVILDLDRWVLRQACLQIKRWNDRNLGLPNLQISVNISAAQLTRTRLVEEVGSALEEASLEPSLLQLEITESAAVEASAAVEGALGELRALGVGVAVEDFGTGYSSLAQLTRFPADTVKIDSSVVATLGQEETRGGAVISAVVALSRSLGCKVVAEGVENDDQLQRLRKLGCELIQGNHLSPPLPAESIDL